MLSVSPGENTDPNARCISGNPLAKACDEVYRLKPVRAHNRKLHRETILKGGYRSFFECDYGGHSRLAREIVGTVKYIVDPEGYLERLGWTKNYRSAGHRSSTVWVWEWTKHSQTRNLVSYRARA